MDRECASISRVHHTLWLEGEFDVPTAPRPKEKRGLTRDGKSRYYSRLVFTCIAALAVKSVSLFLIPPLLSDSTANTTGFEVVWKNGSTIVAVLLQLPRQWANSDLSRCSRHLHWEMRLGVLLYQINSKQQARTIST